MGRALVVDDDESIVLGLGGLLGSTGHEALFARSGKEALALLEGVETVVAGYAMPEMNGVELIQALHRRDQTLPAVLLTAHGSEAIEARAGAEGRGLSTSPGRSTPKTSCWSWNGRWEPTLSGWRTAGSRLRGCWAARSSRTRLPCVSFSSAWR